MKQLNPNCLLYQDSFTGADPGEVKWVNFHPLFSEPASFFLFSYPSNIDWFYYIITKIHPLFQNPGSAPASVQVI